MTLTTPNSATRPGLTKRVGSDHALWCDRTRGSNFYLTAKTLGLDVDFKRAALNKASMGHLVDG